MSCEVANISFLVCPITTRRDKFPLHLDMPSGLTIYGVVAVEQVRAFDLEARNPRFVESVKQSDDPSFIEHVRECLKSFF